MLGGLLVKGKAMGGVKVLLAMGQAQDRLASALMVKERGQPQKIIIFRSLDLKALAIPAFRVVIFEL
jgi:hypothetical protein